MKSFLLLKKIQCLILTIKKFKKFALYAHSVIQWLNAHFYFFNQNNQQLLANIRTKKNSNKENNGKDHF